jgi:malate dehydrogenase (oxaloacetate-decarboxylating)
MVDYKKLSLQMHEKKKGKLEIRSKVPLKNRHDLSVAYTPGVAEPCLKINQNKDDVYKYTSKGNLVAVVTDGTAVLGLGDIGPEASLPVMEGKCVLFKAFADVDAIPIAINSKEADDIVRTIKMISPSLGGINLEDISAPRCFEIEERLKRELNIPVFHDDQHGTAIVTVAGLGNALKLAKKSWGSIKIVMSGAGAAGTATTKLLLKKGAKNIVVVDRAGAIFEGRIENMNLEKEALARITNPRRERGTLQAVMKNANVFIGVSSPGLLTEDMVKSMAPKAIIFAMANPIPEIMPDIAKKAGAFIIATGRSDFPNQINNVLAFPGVFRGALDCRAKEINEEMKLAAADAIMSAVKKPTASNIIPDPFTPGLAKKVAKSVIDAAKKTKVNRI